MHDLVRAGSLAEYATLVRQLGGDPKTMLEDVGLSEDMLAEPDRYLPYRNVLAALEAGRQRLAVDDFGLRLANVQDFDFIGPLALAIQSSESIEAGMSAAATHLRFHTPGARLRILDGENLGEVTVQFRILVKDLAPAPQGIEHAVGHLNKVVGLLSEGEIAPKQIHFRHKAMSSESVYQKHLSQIPKFESTFDGIVMDRDHFAQALPHHNKQLKDFVERCLINVAPPVDLPINEQLRDVLANLLRASPPSLCAAAEILRLSPRTLQRRLQASGHSFQEILDGARKDFTLSLLAQESIPLSLVAHSLGFSEQSVLTRACRRWFGHTPSEIRKSLKSRASRSGIAKK